MNYILAMVLTISGHPPVMQTAEFASFEACRAGAKDWLESIKNIDAEWRAYASCSAKGDDV